MMTMMPMPIQMMTDVTISATEAGSIFRPLSFKEAKAPSSAGVRLGPMPCLMLGVRNSPNTTIKPMSNSHHALVRNPLR